jgi:hypothetical protein
LGDEQVALERGVEGGQAPDAGLFVISLRRDGTHGVAESSVRTSVKGRVRGPTLVWFPATSPAGGLKSISGKTWLNAGVSPGFATKSGGRRRLGKKRTSRRCGSHGDERSGRRPFRSTEYERNQLVGEL